MSSGGQGINIGGIYADLELNSGKLDQGLAKARQALEAIAAESRKLQADFSRGAIGSAELAARLSALTQTANELTNRMQAAYAATNTLHTGMEIFNAAAGRAGAGARNLGMMMMQLGYIADDVQYGFMGIVNNVAPLVMSMTGSAGIAAAAQVVTVGIYQLTQHWDQFLDAIGVGVIRTEAEEMEKLGKATSRTADEQERLNKYKREEKTIKEIKEAEPKEDRERRALVEKAFGEAGTGAVRGALMGQLRGKMTPEEQRDVEWAELFARHKAEAAGPESYAAREAAQYHQDLLTKVNERLTAEAGTAADKLMAQATQSDAEGTAARAEIEAMRKRAPGAFPKKFGADTLANADPEVLRRIDQANEAEASSIEAAGREGAEAAAEEREMDDLAWEKAEASGKAITEAKRKTKENRRKNVEAAREAAPGVEDLAERVMQMAGAGMTTPWEAQEQIEKFLIARGRTPEQAEAAAADIAVAKGRDIEAGALKDFLNPERVAAKEHRASQVFDAADLAGRIQAGVGAEDTAKKQLEEQRELRRMVATMIGSGMVTLRIKK
jgi:hypothetical protein